jgi:hypothetical protein
VSDTTPAPAKADYAGLGYVANPFPPIDDSSTDPLWERLVFHAASNSLLSGVLRAASGERSRPVVVTMSEDVPDHYPRLSLNTFLSRTADDPALSMMALNVPLEMMRLGSIRGTLAEIAELVAAVDLGSTVGAYLADVLRTPNAGLSEYQALAPGQIEEAQGAFAADPRSAWERFFGSRVAAVKEGPTVEEDEALHDVYLRQVTLEKDPDDAQEAGGEEPTGAEAALTEEPSEEEAVPEKPRDEAVREYLLAHLRADLSPVIARALGTCEKWGRTMVAQELKVTKAPRKTLTALLRLMTYRWKHVFVLYDRFDPWPMMDQQPRMDALAALTELRWIIGEHGVMGVLIVKGQAIEVEEQFAAGEQVDWSMPELTPLYNGEFAFDAARVQRWLDAAASAGESAIKADGPELAPLVDACEDDVLRFALMAEAAFRNAAERGSATIDKEAVTVGLASVTIEDGV